VSAEVLTALALGIGLSASCGFRVFVPMLVASIAAHVGLLPLQDGFRWLGSWPAMICFGTATVVEVVAYYVPFIDNLLDTLTTPLAIGTGTLLMTSVLPVDSDMLKWTTGLVVGGGAAAVIQGGSVLTRLASSKVTAGTGNNLLATGENAAAIGTSVLSLVIPWIVAAILLVVIAGVLVALARRHFFAGKRRHDEGQETR